MRSAVYFNWFLCVAFFIAGRQVHADTAPAKQFQQIASSKTASSPADAIQAEFKLPASGQAATNIDSVIGVEDDDDDDGDSIDKQAPVIRYHTEVLSRSALPPPANIVLNRIPNAAPSSLLRSCRYLAHRALLI